MLHWIWFFLPCRGFPIYQRVPKETLVVKTSIFNRFVVLDAIFIVVLGRVRTHLKLGGQKHRVTCCYAYSQHLSIFCFGFTECLKPVKIIWIPIFWEIRRSEVDRLMLSSGSSHLIVALIFEGLNILGKDISRRKQLLFQNLLNAGIPTICAKLVVRSLLRTLWKNLLVILCLAVQLDLWSASLIVNFFFLLIKICVLRHWNWRWWAKYERIY